MNGAAVSSGMGTCGFVGQIGVISGWFSPSEKAVEWAIKKFGNEALTASDIAINPGFMDWFGLLMVCFVLPAVISWAFGKLFRKINWITIIGSAVTITAVSPINPADSRKLSSPWKLMSCNLFSISMTRNLPNEEIRKKTAQNW